MNDHTLNDAEESSRPAENPRNVYGATLADGDAGIAAEPAATGAGDAARDLYKVVRQIGEGGMGTLSLAKDTRLGRWVTLKRLSAEFAKNARLLERFRTEGCAIAALSHNHIVHVYAMAEDEEGPYIVMEYVAGPQCAHRDGWPAGLPNPPLDLEEYVKMQGVLDTAQAVEVGRKLASAVAYAHRRGVVHRDIKPANIMINEDGEPKLADFGLARHEGVGRQGMTLPGVQLLTLGYGAPEQESDASQADARADVYALGGTIWFLLTGQNPRYFRESEAPEPLREILVTALQKDREKRFQSASELEQALANVNAHGAGALRLRAGAGAAPGRCRECGHQHVLDVEELRRSRYCESCGASLFESCLQCGRSNGVWSSFCGFCGSDVNAAWQNAARRLNADRDRVIWLRRQSRFEEAISLIERMEVESGHPRLVEFAQWVSETLPKMRSDFSAALSRRDQTFQSAQAEISAHNYEAALSLLETLPAPLQNEQYHGLVATAWARIEESAQLRVEIGEQAKSGQHKGLKAKVLRFLELRTDAKMQGLLRQIERREAKEHEKYWHNLELRPSLAAYERYLEAHPSGPYAALAQQRVAQCKARAEEELWSAISGQPANAPAYCEYLKKYPGGKHVEQARAIAAPFLRQELLRNLNDVALRNDYLDKRTQALAVEDERLARRSARVLCAIAGLVGGVLLGSLVGGFAGWPGASLSGLLMGIAVHFFLDDELRGKMTRAITSAVAVARQLAQQKPDDADLVIGGLVILVGAVIWLVLAVVLGLVVGFSSHAELLCAKIAFSGAVGALTAATMAAIACRFVKGYSQKASLGPLPWFAYVGRLSRLRADYLGMSASSAPAKREAGTARPGP